MASIRVASPLHICHISATFLHRARSTKRTYVILRNLVEAGFKVSLIVGPNFEPYPDWNIRDIQVIKIPSFLKYMHPIKDLSATVQLFRVLRLLKPDLVHTHLAKGGIIGRIAGFLAGVPKVLHTVHGPTFPPAFVLPKRCLSWTLEKLVSGWTDFFVFVGEDLKTTYIKFKIAKEEKSIVIPTGRPMLDFERVKNLNEQDIQKVRRTLGCSKGDFLIVCVGRIVPSKQQTHAIEVLKRLREIGISSRLFLAGEALLPEEQNYKQRLVALSHSLGVADYVHFIGFREDILDIIFSADAVLLTSSYEGLPNIAVEALMTGTPLVSYEVSGIRELINKNGANFFIAKPFDINAIVRHLIKLSKKDEFVDRGAIDVKLDTLLPFTAEKMVDSKLALYKKILNSAEYIR